MKYFIESTPLMDLIPKQSEKYPFNRLQYQSSLENLSNLYPDHVLKVPL